MRLRPLSTGGEKADKSNFSSFQMLLMMFCVIRYRMHSTGPSAHHAPAATIEPTTRVVRARRSLPNGRAVVGAFLVTSAAVGAFLLSGSTATGPSTDYLVVTTDVAAGATLTADDVVAERLDLGTVSDAAVVGTAAIDGAVALRDLRAGELLVHDDLLTGADTGEATIAAIHELTIPVPLDRSPAALFPGDRVTVLATGRATDDLQTEVAAEDVPVLGFDTGVDRIGGSSQGVLTLAVDDPAVVLTLAHAAQHGDLTVVRTTRALDDVYPASPSAPIASGRVDQ